MNENDPLKRETDALIEAIWGPTAIEPPLALDPQIRAAQNSALAVAMRAYLQQYLQEL